MARTRLIIWVSVALLTLCLAVMIWKWHQWRITADAGAAYAARITCSCRFVQGRSPVSCAQDVEHDAAAVTITEDDLERRITGSVPMLAERSAIYRHGFGCLIEPR